MFDIPHIHNPNRPESNLVAKALSEVDVDDSDLLRSTTIRSIITFRWQLTRRYVIIKLLVPYSIYLLLYILYVTAVF